MQKVLDWQAPRVAEWLVDALSSWRLGFEISACGLSRTPD